MKEQNQFLLNIILTALLSVTIWFMHEDNKTLAVIFNNKLYQGEVK
jgi:hypothetical protein